MPLLSFHVPFVAHESSRSGVSLTWLIPLETNPNSSLKEQNWVISPANIRNVPEWPWQDSTVDSYSSWQWQAIPLLPSFWNPCNILLFYFSFYYPEIAFVPQRSTTNSQVCTTITVLKIPSSEYSHLNSVLWEIQETEYELFYFSLASSG